MLSTKSALTLIASWLYFLGAAYAQEALPERKCGPLDKSGRCADDRGAPSPPPTPTLNQRQYCQSNCNAVYGQCLAISRDDRFKEDCNRKQVFCMKAC
jgi:hypothetical protein